MNEPNLKDEWCLRLYREGMSVSTIADLVFDNRPDRYTARNLVNAGIGRASIATRDERGGWPDHVRKGGA
ncbi:hypothetical protein U0C82_03820 [Fulvimarina sp. 2208YS6-2-32]|uniref:Helix-turn-helix domain containing protein n=1 Tax=Fulvimarina uroteuthidis TaxID=3098149 RepID=A0ABU5HYX7_9HYPH|nr:hypothetical protein [Fulvimarina sp. 2208YS6-2-32]MDY8108277.1 hypothetical protein [Fulvimarina sp. 2208YS6-2-32]